MPSTTTPPPASINDSSTTLDEDAIEQRVFDLVERAETYELLALDPAPQANPPTGNFHRWIVNHRFNVGDAATQRQLTDAL